MNRLIPFIWAAGVVQLLVASANIVLPRKLRYAENLAKLSPIVRQVFVVHSVYIVLVLLFLSALCLGFAPELASGRALGKFVSRFIAVFWGTRVLIQLFYYDEETKRQNRFGHFLFTVLFLYLAGVFAVATLGVTP